MVKFSAKLKELRVAAGLTQKELGNIFFVNQQTISNWENGKREPDFDTIIIIATYFNVTTDYLLGLED